MSLNELAAQEKTYKTKTPATQTKTKQTLWQCPTLQQSFSLPCSLDIVTSNKIENISTQPKIGALAKGSGEMGNKWGIYVWGYSRKYMQPNGRNQRATVGLKYVKLS